MISDMLESAPSRTTPSGRIGPAIRLFLRTLNRRKWILLTAGLLPPLVTLAALSIGTPEYTATTHLALKAGSSNSITPVHMGTAIESSALLEKVIERLNLNHDPEFLFMPVSFFDAPLAWTETSFRELFGTGSSTSFSSDEAGPFRHYRSVVDALRRRIMLSVQMDSTILVISVRSADRNKAKLLTDTLASIYVEGVARADLEDEKRAAQKIAEQLSALRRNADAARQAAKEFRQNSGILGDTAITTTSRALSDSAAQLSQTQEQVLDHKSRILALQGTRSGTSTRGGATDVIASPAIAALRIQESEASRHLLEASQRYGENHPRVTGARAELASVRGAIASEAKRIVSTLERELVVAQAREKELQQHISTLEQRVRSSEQKEIELRQLERAAEKEDATYRDLERRINESSGLQKSSIYNVRILAPASLPTSPSYPRYVEAALIALITGLLVGLLWTWLLELLDSGFRTGEQIERQTGRLSIGMIPALPRYILKQFTPVRYVTEKPISAYAEALRSVQTSISLGSEIDAPRVIMITSSVPGEGKSTFSCSLAQLVARSNPGKKIIIVDCDLRRSTVRKMLDVPETLGTIDEYLSGIKDLHMIIGRDERSGLYYIPAKVDTANSAELLASPKMRALATALASEFDLVLLDAPPLMAVADPRVVAELADYVIFLIQWEKTDRDLAVAALKLLADVSQVGVVLSQVDLRRHALYGYADRATYYSKYSSYYLNS